jgi:hypothetical protein
LRQRKPQCKPKRKGFVLPEPIYYADLWALLRKLGFNCDTVLESNHRVCEFAPTDTRIVLHNYPPDHPVRSQNLVGVRLQLDNGGVMSRDDFDYWAARKARANARNATNGSKLTPKKRKDASPPSSRKDKKP